MAILIWEYERRCPPFVSKRDGWNVGRLRSQRLISTKRSKRTTRAVLLVLVLVLVEAAAAALAEVAVRAT